VTGGRHPAVLVCTLIGLAVFIPYVARVVFPDSSIHPVSFVALVVALLVMIFRRKEAAAELRRHWPIYAAGLLVAAVGLAMTLLNRGDYGKAYVVNHMVVPLALFAIVQVTLYRRVEAVRTVGMVLVLMGCFQTLLGALQLYTQSPLVFTSKYGEQIWMEAMISEGRVMGTLDHPLVLALFLLICIPLVFSFRNVYVRAGSAAILMVGVLLTQSRLAAVGGALMLVILFFQSVSTRRARVVIVTVIGFALVAVALSPIGQTLIGRFQNDQGSNTRRFVALELFGSVWHEHIWGGSGFGSSYLLTEGASLKSSLENPVLMMAVDIGLVWAIIWVALQIGVALGLGPFSRLNRRRGTHAALYIPGSWLSTLHLQFAAVAALLFTQSFSSTATESASAMLVWFVLALFAVARTNTRLGVVGTEAGSTR